MEGFVKYHIWIVDDEISLITGDLNVETWE